MLKHSSLLILISFLLPAYLIRFSFAGIPTTLLEVAIWAAALFGASQPIVRRSWVSAAKHLPRPILLFSLIFFLSAVLGMVVSPHPETSLGILKAWILTPILYAFLVYASIRHSDFDIRHYANVLILSGLVVALLGLSQLGQLDRIRGPYDVPNSLALFLAPLIVLSFSSFALRHSSFAGYASAIMFLALLFTQSLAGILSVLAVLGLSLCFGYWKLKPVWILCFGFCALAATLVLLPKVNYLLQPNSSAAVRLQLWSISWELIQEHPLLGIGLGTFEPAYQQKLHERFARPASAGQPTPLAEFVFRDPHNWILSFWLNLGLIGLLSFTSLNGYALWRSVRTPIALALLTLLIFGLTDTIFWKNDLATLHWLLLALASTIRPTSEI